MCSLKLWCLGTTAVISCRVCAYVALCSLKLWCLGTAVVSSCRNRVCVVGFVFAVWSCVVELGFVKRLRDCWKLASVLCDLQVLVDEVSAVFVCDFLSFLCVPFRTGSWSFYRTRVCYVKQEFCVFRIGMFVTGCLLRACFRFQTDARD